MLFFCGKIKRTELHYKTAAGNDVCLLMQPRGVTVAQLVLVQLV